MPWYHNTGSNPKIKVVKWNCWKHKQGRQHVHHARFYLVGDREQGWAGSWRHGKENLREQDQKQRGWEGAPEEKLQGPWYWEQAGKEEFAHEGEEEDCVASWIKRHPGWVTGFQLGNNMGRRLARGMRARAQRGKSLGWDVLKVVLGHSLHSALESLKTAYSNLTCFPNLISGHII